MIKSAFTFMLVFFNCICFAQGSMCADSVGDEGANPFCSSTGILFANCSRANDSCSASAESGANYGCLGSQPFPAWYYLQIEDEGLLSFSIVQTGNEDGTGAQLDVDFICYGPFSDPVSPCLSELTAGNTIDCSYLPDFSETMTIGNAQSGEYYLVLITNYSGSSGFISFQQTNGEGSTDCSILEAVLGPNQNICGTDSVELDGTTEGAIRYQWSMFNEATSVFDTLPGEVGTMLMVLNSGRYQLLVEDIDGDIETDEIVITLNSIPVVENVPLDITVCELNSNFAEFDLTNNTSLIMGEQDPTRFSVTYYLSQSDLDTRENSVSEVLTTTATRVFARIENVDLVDCYDEFSFQLFVDPIPKLSANYYRYNICEPLDGTPSQATLMFSEVLSGLTNNAGESLDLLAGDEPLVLSDFSITYHNSVLEAISGTNPFVDNTVVTDGDIIYIRVQNNQAINITGCFNVGNIPGVKVSIGQIPEINTDIPDLVMCATFIEDQNTATFDLTENDGLISVVNSLIGSKVFYYASQEDLDTGVSIANPRSFVNTTNPQTIFTIVVDSVLGCGRSPQSSFNVKVLALPVLIDSEAFSGLRDVCVFPDGMVQDITIIGEDIGAVDGQVYIYDWTPDNVDEDNDGNEDPIYFVDELLSEQVFTLAITRVDFFGTGVDCSNSLNPVKSEPYEITLRPTSGPVSVGFEVSESSFLDNYTITAIPEIFIGDLSDLEYSLDGFVFQDSAVFTNVSGGDYVITVRNRYRCQSTAVSQLIQLLDYDKYFTPNGDGVHETWSLVNIKDQPTALIYIFDKQGRLLKQLKPGGSGWDGTYNGGLMPSSEYWFRVEFNESFSSDTSRKVFIGSFSLIR